MPADQALIEAICAALAAEGDPARAAEQQRYMKSAMPYVGLTLPRTRAIARPLLRGYAPPDRGSHEQTRRAL